MGKEVNDFVPVKYASDS
jgi:AFG3 family protein